MTKIHTPNPKKESTMTKIYRPPRKPPTKKTSTNTILRLVEKIKDKENSIKRLNTNQPKDTEKKPTTDKETTKKTEVDDEYTKELEWREKEVARVFKEGRNRGGRPTKLNEQLIVDMEVLARIGLSDKAMAESVGLAPTTFIQWMKKNKEFSNRIKKAKNEGKSKLINSLYGHGQKNWQSIAWLLERCFHSEFALNQKMELTGKDGGPLTFKVVYEDKKETAATKPEEK
jgi:hypothetical protein